VIGFFRAFRGNRQSSRRNERKVELISQQHLRLNIDLKPCLPATITVHPTGIQPDSVLFPLFEHLFVEHVGRDGRQRRDSSLPSPLIHQTQTITQFSFPGQRASTGQSTEAHLHVVSVPIAGEMRPLHGRVVEGDGA
jgi:hypothetical protein